METILSALIGGGFGLFGGDRFSELIIFRIVSAFQHPHLLQPGGINGLGLVGLALLNGRARQTL